jgi:L-asparaginase
MHRAFMLRIPIAAVLLLALTSPTHAQSDLPDVHVVATGGTISNTGDTPRRSGNELVDALPGIERIADVSTEQFLNTFSGAITLEQWRQLALRINELFRTRPELAGVVVTHGTDTMEETAYFLDLTVRDCRPVVLTGAMRRAVDIGPDGPANLFDAIQLAAHPRARRMGAVLLMNDEIFPAREVTKTHTSRPDAFEAPGAGPVGVADSDAIVFYGEPVDRSCGERAFDLSGVRSLPRVDVIYAYQGADGSLIRAAVAAGAKGIVTAGVGRGGTTPGQSEALAEAVSRGVFVVASNRTGAGRVPVGGEDRLDAWQPGRGARIGAGDLNPQKARILLMLALTRTRDAREIMKIFESY